MEYISSGNLENLIQALHEMEERMQELQNLCEDRKMRLSYFMNEGVSHKIIQKALTSVEEAEVAILNLRIQKSKLKEKISGLADCLT